MNREIKILLNRSASWFCWASAFITAGMTHNLDKGEFYSFLFLVFAMLVCARTAELYDQEASEIESQKQTSPPK